MCGCSEQRQCFMILFNVLMILLLTFPLKAFDEWKLILHVTLRRFNWKALWWHREDRSQMCPARCVRGSPGVSGHTRYRTRENTSSYMMCGSVRGCENPDQSHSTTYITNILPIADIDDSFGGIYFSGHVADLKVTMFHMPNAWVCFSYSNPLQLNTTTVP